MNIDYTELNPTSHSQANSPQSVENESRVEKKDVQRNQLRGRDEAELSDLARIMSKVHPVLEENPEIRTELVESIRTQLENGDYRIPVDKIVDRLISGKG
jgi:flagellar biosynthesis anti-sigma factor FlgM